MLVLLYTYETPRSDVPYALETPCLICPMPMKPMLGTFPDAFLTVLGEGPFTYSTPPDLSFFISLAPSLASYLLSTVRFLCFFFSLSIFCFVVFSSYFFFYFIFSCFSFLLKSSQIIYLNLIFFNQSAPIINTHLPHNLR